MTRGYANSWTSVRLPEADLAEIVLEVAAPLLSERGSGAPIEQAREVLALRLSASPTPATAGRSLKTARRRCMP